MAAALTVRVFIVTVHRFFTTVWPEPSSSFMLLKI
jgi:hypothetical protein